MLAEESRPVLENIRRKALSPGLAMLSVDKLSDVAGIAPEQLKALFPTEEALVDQLLTLEREKFLEIFTRYDFENKNSIDVLMTVSTEVAQKYNDISPVVTRQLQDKFPEIYQQHFEKRINFVASKIRINLENGIRQGLYRGDLSIELVSRLYISRLIDLHNPDFFPPETFSFQTIFNQMFESFIRSIATAEGLTYFEKQKSNILHNGGFGG